LLDIYNNAMNVICSRSRHWRKRCWTDKNYRARSPPKRL